MYYKNGSTQKAAPDSRWREELATKAAEQDKLYREYVVLKSETAKVEKIKRSVTEILHSETPDRKTQKSRRMEK